MNTRALILLPAGLMAFAGPLAAQTVELQSVTQQVDDAHRLLKQRVYVAASADHPQFKFLLKAASNGTTWWLELRAADGRDAQYPVFGRDEIIGADGLLSKCIERFKADVPDAKVNMVLYYAIMSGPLWADIMGNLAPLYKKWGKFEVREYYIEGKTVESTLNESAQVKEVAGQIAKQLNEPLLKVDTHLDENVVGRVTEIKTWAEALKLPNYGIVVESVGVAVELKTKAAAPQ